MLGIMVIMISKLKWFVLVVVVVGGFVEILLVIVVEVDLVWVGWIVVFNGVLDVFFGIGIWLGN